MCSSYALQNEAFGIQYVASNGSNETEPYGTHGGTDSLKCSPVKLFSLIIEVQAATSTQTANFGLSCFSAIGLRHAPHQPRSMG